MRTNTTMRFTDGERLVLRRAANRVGVRWTSFARDAAVRCAMELLNSGIHGSAEGPRIGNPGAQIQEEDEQCKTAI